MNRIDGIEGYHGLYEGTVIDTDDKLELHRIRADIPGVCKASAWARPRTFGGGADKRGGNSVPMVGSAVLVQFVGGELLRPVYEGGPWGRAKGGPSQLPTDILAAGAKAAEVSSFELSRGATSFRFTVDEREGHRSWRVVAVEKSGQAETVIGSIELDVERRVLDLFGLGGVQLRSLGFIDVRALVTRLQRRRVRRTASPL